MICIFLAVIIDCITPLLLQQKLQQIAIKYMYVIEKYGYLTSREKTRLIEELSTKGFETSKITIEYPKSQMPYGSLIEFSISYKYTSIPLLGTEEKQIKISRVSYSKI